jgi:hypothetical protein
VFIQSAAVLEAVKARPGNGGVRRYGGATAGRDSFCARRRRKSAVGAEESLRRGRTKERAQAKTQVSKKKVLAFVAAIRERRNGPRIEQRNGPERKAPPASAWPDTMRQGVHRFRPRRLDPSPKRTNDVLPKPDNLKSYRHPGVLTKRYLSQMLHAPQIAPLRTSNRKDLAGNEEVRG